jgi:hypothetical protein
MFNPQIDGSEGSLLSRIKKSSSKMNTEVKIYSLVLRS